LPSKENRRIARNTIMLYVRMMMTMAISFYATRIVLDALGVVDYGLANVIGSTVAMFAFLKITLSSAASRFFNYELGRQDGEELRRTFSMILQLHGGLFVIMLVLLETLGLWIFKNKLLVPPGRLHAATLFFHLTVATLLIGIWSVPYQAIMISHEDMGIYAWFSILEAAAKLGAVCLLAVSSFDKLVAYGALLCAVSALHTILYQVVCRLRYPETRFTPCFHKEKFAQLLSFSGWNVFGAAGYLIGNTVTNILLNNHFGAAINATRGIANQVTGGASVFALNFLTATRPQIVKLWAENNRRQYRLLVRRAAKMGYCLLLVVALPVLLETGYILNLWLRKVPDAAVLFTRLAVVAGLVESLSHPVSTAIQATGKIGAYQAVVGAAIALSVVATWAAFAAGGPPHSAMVVAVLLSCCLVAIRLAFHCRHDRQELARFLQDVLFPVLLVTAGAIVAPALVSAMLPAGPLRLGGVCLTAAAGIFLLAFLFVLNPDERTKLLTVAGRRIRLAFSP
jgi:O-antigen/teichoic acid export membrane protein